MNLIDLFPNFRKNGTEHHGPCPSCGGKDRFIIWENQGFQKKLGTNIGRFLCRQCGITGDGIDYFRIVEGLSFPDAASKYGIESEEYVGSWEDRPDIIYADNEKEYAPNPYDKGDPEHIWASWLFSPAESVLSGLRHAYEETDPDLHETLIEMLNMRMGALLHIARRYYRRHGNQLDAYIRTEWKQDIEDSFSLIGLRMPDKMVSREDTGAWIRVSKKEGRKMKRAYMFRPDKNKIAALRKQGKEVRD